MANYAETIAYWYLRLNGYLLLNRFVLHRLGDIREDPTDSDLLGVRFQHVYEPIGGQAGDWDPYLVRSVFPLAATSAVVVEVKGGGETRPGDAFAEQRLRDALMRLGIISRGDAAGFAETLTPLPHHVDARAQMSVSKFLFARDLRGEPCMRGHYHAIPLKHALDFIRTRIGNYPVKASDWNFFPDDLVQFFIMEGHLNPAPPA